MNCWQTLNLEPTQDTTLIKRAYAVLLKQHRPDRDPEGFKRIKAAYDEAIWLSQFEWVDEGDADDEWQADSEHDPLAVTAPNDEVVTSITDTAQDSQPLVITPELAAQINQHLNDLASSQSAQSPQSSEYTASEHVEVQPDLADSIEITQHRFDPSLIASSHDEILSDTQLLDDWLLPDEWLRQLSELLHSADERTHYTSDAWTQWCTDGSQFMSSANIRLEATGRVLQHLEYFYHDYLNEFGTPTEGGQNVLDYVYRLSALSRPTLKMVADTLGWWQQDFMQQWQGLIAPEFYRMLTADKKLLGGKNYVAILKHRIFNRYAQKPTHEYFGTLSGAGVVRRLMALFIDALTYAPIAFVIHGMMSSFSRASTFLINLCVALGFIIYLVIWECSPYKSTLGGRTFSIRLLNNEAKTPSIPAVVIYFLLHAVLLGLISLSIWGFVALLWFIAYIPNAISKITNILTIKVPNP